MIDQIQRSPVVRGILRNNAHHTQQRERQNRQQPPPVRRRLLIGLLLAVQLRQPHVGRDDTHPITGQRQDDDCCRHHPTMNGQRHPKTGRQRPGQGRHGGPDAPGRVQRAHDGASGPDLNGHSLGVLSRIDVGVQHAHQEEGDGEGQRACCAGGQRQHQCGTDGANQGDLQRAVTGDEACRQRADHQSAGAHRRHHDPVEVVAEFEGLLDLGQPGHQGQHQPVGEEVQ